jgi:hypothetical protein
VSQKMNPEIKARWVAALRSGEYKQAREKLRHNGAHCCLGVLCDLFAKEDGRPKWRTKDLSEQGPHQAYELPSPFADKNMPGATVLVWAQLDPYRKICIGKSWQTLYNHNDEGRTFAEIADAIEAQL